MKLGGRERIEYKPYSIKELLVKMKDTAMLMVDLSYAALLFRDKELSEEVLELEREIDTLNYYLQITTMLAARDAEDAEALQSILRVAHLTDVISDCAGDIVEAVAKEKRLHPIIIEGLKRVEEPILALKMEEGSQLSRKSLGDLKLRTEVGVQVIAIRRGSEWIVHPGKEEKLYPGDVVIVRGSGTGIERFKIEVGGRS